MIIMEKIISKVIAIIATTIVTGMLIITEKPTEVPMVKGTLQPETKEC